MERRPSAKSLKFTDISSFLSFYLPVASNQLAYSSVIKSRLAYTSSDAAFMSHASIASSWLVHSIHLNWETLILGKAFIYLYIYVCVSLLFMFLESWRSRVLGDCAAVDAVVTFVRLNFTGPWIVGAKPTSPQTVTQKHNRKAAVVCVYSAAKPEPCCFDK